MKMPRMTLGARPAGREGRAERQAWAAARGAVVPQMNVIADYMVGVSGPAELMLLETDCARLNGTVLPCDEDHWGAWIEYVAGGSVGPWVSELCCWSSKD
jgi:hypothetical protein